MIPANVIEDLKYRCDVESVISSYVTLKRAGRNLKGLCPFHSENTPSFTVYPETQSFYCYGCGAGGDVVNFLMRVENLDYVSALETLAKRAGVTLPDFDNSGYKKNDEVSKKRVIEMNLEAAKFYRQMLFDENIGKAGMDYFIGRKLSSAIIKRFGLGYSPARGNLLLKHMKSLGYTEKELQVAYFANNNSEGHYYDYFRGRVMFPIIDITGNVIAFGGRVLDDSKPKYMNTSDTPAFKKSKNLFALNYAKNSDADYFLLCEGYMDVITLHDAGFNMAIAALGTAITPDHARLIRKYKQKVVISTDSDEAGQTAAARAISILEAAGLDVKVLNMTGAKDPDEYIKKFGVAAFRSLIEGSRSKFDFVVAGITSKYALTNSDEKIRAVGEVEDYIAKISSNVERDIYITKASETFGVDRTSLARDVEVRIRKLRKQSEINRRNDLIRTTAGLGDRINRDFAKAPKAARIEETLLGMIFINNQYIELKSDGRPLESGDFVTELNRRLFEYVSEALENGGFSLVMLNEAFSQDEISRVYQIIAERNELSGNTEDAYKEYLKALRTEGGKQSKDLSLEELLAKKRNNN